MQLMERYPSQSDQHEQGSSLSPHRRNVNGARADGPGDSPYFLRRFFCRRPVSTNSLPMFQSLQRSFLLISLSGDHMSSIKKQLFIQRGAVFMLRRILLTHTRQPDYSVYSPNTPSKSSQKRGLPSSTGVVEPPYHYHKVML